MKCQTFNNEICEYEQFKDDMYYADMKERIETDRSFRKVFKVNLTDRFMSRIKSVTDVSYRGFNMNTIISINGETGCQPKGSKVLMADGEWKNIEDIKIGDMVISYDENMKSIFSRVIKRTTWSCDENYIVYQKNRHGKKLYSCSYNHIIPFNKRKTHRLPNIPKRSIENVRMELPAKSFYKFSSNVLDHHATGITCPPILSFDQKDCAIEPYSLGVYISDGSFSSTKKNRQLHITSDDQIVMEHINKIYPFSSIGKKNGTTCKTYRWSMKSKIAKLLNEYGYESIKSEKKFIPKQALKSSIDYRLKLIAGLIDGDGYFDNGCYVFCQKSSKLVKHIEYLVWSIGGFVNQIKKKKGTIKSRNFVGDYWHICFRLPQDLKIPILTKRRKNTKSSYLISTNRQAIILKKNQKTKQVYGFTLDSPTGYYITDNWMLTHNSGKSACMFSLGLKYFRNFTYKNMKFFDQDILESAHTFEPHTLIIRDENPAKAVFGQGSTRTQGQFGLLAESCRKASLNLAMIEPSFQQNDITKIYLHVVDQDLKNRINRCGLIHPKTLRYMGSVLIPIMPESHPEWQKYQAIKDSFIEKMKNGDFSGSKLDYKSVARESMNDPDFENYKNKQERKAYLVTKYPNYTSGEIETILAMMNVIKREGESG